MSNCCRNTDTSLSWRAPDAENGSKPRSRFVTPLGWILPATVLALMPKCPACVAAYAAIIGVGLSFSAASYVRASLIGFSAVLLCIMCGLSLNAMWRRHRGVVAQRLLQGVGP